MSRSRIPIARPWRIVLFVVNLAASSPLAHAAGGIYAPPKDYATDWARNITLLLAVVAMGLVAFTLLLRRGRLGAFQSKGLLFLGLCVLPLPVMVLTSAVGLEHAKAVTFCESCHSMRTLVTDMEDPGSDSLAALHFKNRYIQDHHCYACHTDYGMFGDAEAKLSGLRHIWQDAAGTSSLPIKMQDRYRFTICLNCHGQSRKFLDRKSHAGSLGKFVSGETLCSDCHGRSHRSGRGRG